MTDHVFQCYMTRDLRKQGLSGSEVWVRLSDEVVDLSGTEGGQLRIRLDDVTRIRVGYLDAKGRTYETRIWRSGVDKPLRLTSTSGTWSAYGDAIRALAAGLMARQRLDRIERGYSKFDAVFGPSMMGVLLVGAIGVSVFALGNEPWWGRLLVPLLPLLLFGILLWLGVARYWPRPIGDLNDLDVQLPPTPRR
jgi:hypothetical protein